ncbi:MAG TPA: carboxypeptidase-like regulatory domain-containing protein [Vicinamibacterales bacterium]|nr:carboxypeptidase-like regulatory domain-containing protein [Vicinamibacterales bacterium]
MTRTAARLRFVVMLGLLAFAAGAWPRAQVVQQPAPPQPAVGTGFISGQVVEVPSGRPVPDALIQLSGRGAPPPPGLRAGGVPQQVIVTDSQGRFFFSRLPNGIYTPRVVKTGYESRSIVTVEVGDAERVTDVRLRIAPLSIISGTVRDAGGDPVVGSTMFAFRRGIVNGKAGWQQFRSAVTDDRGAYRISGLTAGDYLVCACARDPIPFDGQLLTTIAAEPIGLLAVAGRALAVGADVVTLDNTVKTYAPRFHPDAASAARATKITLAPGDDKTGVDVALDLVRATRVSGRVVGAQSAVQASAVRLLPAMDAESGIDFTQISPMLVQADGRFDFAPVPPGQYQLIVGHRETGATGGGPSGAALGFLGARGSAAVPAAGGRGGGPGPAGEFMWAIEPVTVGDNGVSGLVVGLNRGLSARGRLQYVGAAPQPPAQQLQRAGVIFSPVNPSRTPFSAPGVVAQDGSFVVQGIGPGKYNVNVPALPGYPTLKSITLGGQDITDLPLDVAEKDLNELVVTFVDTPMASLTVTTQMPPPAQAIDDIIAIVFPADRKYWTEPAAARRRFRSGPMSPKGVMNLAELPAGDYFVLVANATDVLDWQDPARMDVLSRRAQRVTLSDGGKQTVEVRR